MSGVPRSQQLLGFHSTGAGNSPVFTSPEGYVTLVKSAFVYTDTATPGLVNLFAYDGTNSVNLPVFHHQLVTGTTFEWNGWLVLNPLNSIYVQVFDADVLVWVSGAVLAGPNQFPPAFRRLPTQQPHS